MTAIMSTALRVQRRLRVLGEGPAQTRPEAGAGTAQGRGRRYTTMCLVSLAMS